MAAGMLMFILPTQWWGLALTFIPAGIGMSLGSWPPRWRSPTAAMPASRGQAMGLYRGLAVGSGSWRWCWAAWCCWRGPSGPSTWPASAA